MSPKIAIIGPFDPRIRKTRCDNCAKRHLKCDLLRPCSNCVRKHACCVSAPTSAAHIEVSKGKTLVLAKIGNSKAAQIASLPLDHETVSIVNFFQNFIPQSSFNGTEWDSRIMQFHMHDSLALHNIVIAIGCLYSSERRRTPNKASKVRALQAYTTGVECLKIQLESEHDYDPALTIELTILMAIFEVMYTDNASGWRRHFQRGTHAILKSLGPQNCFSGSGRDIFLRYRFLEIMSSIIFARRSFLAEKPWLELLDVIWQGENAAQRNSKEKILDLSTICSDLCLSAAEYAFCITTNTMTASIARLEAFVAEGVRLRSLLEDWRLLNQVGDATATMTPSESVVAWAMYHTLSIYLHTAFTVNPLWGQLGMTIPILEQHAVSQHITAIINLTSDALVSTDLCPLIFMLPLRIAGNCATSLQHRAQVIDLFSQIGQTYGTAQTSISDLSRVWSLSGMLDNGDCCYLVERHHRYSLLGNVQSEIPHLTADDNKI